MKLTKTQQKFVAALQAGATMKDAAIKAGLSPKTARSAGSRLAKHPLVMAALAGMHVEPTQRQKKTTTRASAEHRQETGAAPAPEPTGTTYDDPRDYLRFVMNNPLADDRLRSDAAKALLASEVRKVADVGKKAVQAQVAKSIGAGRFAPSAPPKLVAAGGRKI